VLQTTPFAGAWYGLRRVTVTDSEAGAAAGSIGALGRRSKSGKSLHTCSMGWPERKARSAMTPSSKWAKPFLPAGEAIICIWRTAAVIQAERLCSLSVACLSSSRVTSRVKVGLDALKPPTPFLGLHIVEKETCKSPITR